MLKKVVLYAIIYTISVKEVHTMLKNTGYFAVIDTETNWKDEVMSVGVVIADTADFGIADKLYYIISPECDVGGIYSSVLRYKNVKIDMKDSRSAVMQHLINSLNEYKVKSVFAYNASFDSMHMPEMRGFEWYDIMKIAAYKQYNKSIPEGADCYKTGKLKCNYGVEPIMRMLLNKNTYHEVHNALCDAVDELEIMRLLGLPLDIYENARIG